MSRNVASCKDRCSDNSVAMGLAGGPRLEVEMAGDSAVVRRRTVYRLGVGQSEWTVECDSVKAVLLNSTCSVQTRDGV